MKQLSETGAYTVDEAVKESVQNLFYSGCCDDQGTKQTIKMMYDTENYLCDTHTAVAVNVYHQYVEETGNREIPAIVASTASPYKFAASVLDALTDEQAAAGEFAMVEELSAVSGTMIPEPIAQLKEKKLRFDQVCSASGMKDVVLRMLAIQ